MSDDTRKLSTQDIAEASQRRRDERLEPEHDARLARDREPRVTTSVDRPADERPTPLFGDDELGGYRTRWSAIQTGFVDEPRRAVEEADTLVAELMQRLADGFASERKQLEGQWERSDDVSTEDLRVAMRRYRSFFERLLSI